MDFQKVTNRKYALQKPTPIQVKYGLLTRSILLQSKEMGGWLLASRKMFYRKKNCLDHKYCVVQILKTTKTFTVSYIVVNKIYLYVVVHYKFYKAYIFKTQK